MKKKNIKDPIQIDLIAHLININSSMSLYSDMTVFVIKFYIFFYRGWSMVQHSRMSKIHFYSLSLYYRAIYEEDILPLNKTLE